MNYDPRKYRCNEDRCTAELPEVYCKRVMIQRREIPFFVEYIDRLGDALLSYHILAVKPGRGPKDSGHDQTWIYIYVDPRKHHDPEYLVKGAANVACGFDTMERELDYITNEHDNSSYLHCCRMSNCPSCSKNFEPGTHIAMTTKQYQDSVATFLNTKK